MLSRRKLKPPKRIGEVIARRAFEVLVDGTPRDVELVLGKPVHVEKPDPWACDYQVRGLGRRSVRRVYGIDAIQALLLALQLAEAELSGMVNDPAVKLRWLGSTRLGLTKQKRKRRR